MMDFTALMNQAAQNKQQAEKQFEQKKQRQAQTSNSQGVSGTAVKAFLLRKEREEKQHRVEQEQARKVRLQARLEQVSNSKKGRRKSTDDTTEKNNGQCNPGQRLLGTASSARGPGKEKSTKDRRQNETSAWSTAMSNTHRKEGSKDQHHQRAHYAKPSINQKRSRTGSNEVGKQSGPTVVRNPADRAQGSSTKSKSSSAKAAAPLDFKKLLAMAEHNKNCPSGVVSGLPKKTSAVQNGGKTSQQDFTASPSMGKKSSVRTSRNGQPAHPSRERLQAPRRAEPARSGTSTVRETGTSRNAPGKQMAPSCTSAPASNSRVSRQGRDLHLGGKRRRPIRSSADDGMDDFIDDGGDDVDVSQYIRDIFGYDRTRYSDNDDDCAFMESNFSQIEREEARSAKIAKLEDEVEFLKEQAELKKQRQRLLKQQKKG